MFNSTTQRSGFLAGGNFIVDSVKIIDKWPEQDTLSTILHTKRSNGGGPYNFLKNLARLAPAISRDAVGLLGNDVEGDWVRNDCRAAGIGIDQLTVEDGLTTSLTDVMTVADTGRRTFFHSRGANAHLEAHHFDFGKTSARVFMLGYLMLLDRLDILESNGTTGASRLLKAARQHGLLTAVDCVSVEHPQCREIATASLVEADVFFVNDVEASKILGKQVDKANVEMALLEIVKLGARGTVVLHMPKGAFALNAEKNAVLKQPSLNIPKEQISGASGAGDAFAAGYLYGLHEGWSTQESLICGVCVAAKSLFSPTPSDGLATVESCLKLEEQYGYSEISG